MRFHSGFQHFIAMLFIWSGMATDGWANPLASFTADEIRRMQKGEVLVEMRDTRESTLKDVRTVGILPAEVDKVWSVITDFDHYTRIFRGILKAETRAVTPDYEDHFTLLDYPWPFEDRWTVNRIVASADHRRLTIRRQEGSVKEVAGGWVLEPLDKATLVTYQVRVDPGLPFLPPWAIDWGARHAAPEIILSVRRELSRD